MNSGLFCGNRPPREYPVDNAPPIKQRLWRGCSHMLIREFVSKLRTADVGRGSRPGNVQVKIACQNDRNCRFVLASIVQAIKQLGAAQTVISAALQVKVVADQRSPSNVLLRSPRPSVRRSAPGKAAYQEGTSVAARNSIACQTSRYEGSKESRARVWPGHGRPARCASPGSIPGTRAQRHSSSAASGLFLARH